MFPEFLSHPHLSLSDSESSDEDVGQANKSMDFDPTNNCRSLSFQ